MMKKKIAAYAIVALILVVTNSESWANPIPLRWGRVNNSAPALLGYKCAYDGNAYIYLFGGEDTLGQMPNDVYRFNGHNWNHYEAPGPEGRIGHGLGYSIGSYNLFLFGGKNQEGQYLNDAWIYNISNNTWTKVDSTGPLQRAFCSLVYDQYSQGFVLFGGMNDDSLFGDTWEWNFNSGWHLLTTNGPTPRIDAGFVNTRQDQPLFLYGGRSGPDGEIFNDAWSLWDTNWVEGQQPDSNWVTPRLDFATGVYGSEMIISCGRNTSNPDSFVSDSWRIYQFYPNFHAYSLHLPSLLQNRYSAVGSKGYYNTMIIGGTDGNQILRDVWIYPWRYYALGDVNNNGHCNGMDLLYLVNFWKGVGPAPPLYIDCWNGNMLYATADVDGSCSFDGLDITYMINYFKGFGPAPTSCPNCPPNSY
jgi:hypothetical protein